MNQHSPSSREADFAPSETDIAIVGMAGRFPGAADVDAFWINLRDGVESIVRYSDEELRARGAQDSDLGDPHYVRAGAPLPDMDKFDAAFFGYSPREAEETDPQLRLFLEVAWQALEHAGYDAATWGRPIGVYAGSGVNTYLLLHLMPGGRFPDLRDISSLQGLMNGNNKDSLTTTVSYKLDLRGPSVTVQTACSTSLAAVHVACRGLLNHEADMALAGGVWVNLLHPAGYRHQQGGILSPDGHCRAFDARAAGTVIGSGVGVVALKRLADALTDGDTIHAVIKGSALNNDGAAKVGYTAPSVAGQAEAILAAQAFADTPAETIGYVETHGTGTTIGDPIEIAALTQAFRVTTDKRGFCGVGSVKSNVGHLDAAAGVTGLIKTVLALEHRMMPPSLHFETANPQIDFASSPFYVNAEARHWPSGPTPRRAGVSSFGIGGANVHVVLEEAPPQAASQPPSRPWRLLPLSARTPTALEQAIARMSDHIRERPEHSLADVAYTLQEGRKAFAQRAVVLAHDREEAVEALGDPRRLLVASGAPTDRVSVAFLFPGQGAQHVDMARPLYETEPTFRAAFDRCAEMLKGHLGLDLRTLAYPGAEAGEAASARLSQTELAQPALFAIEYALAHLWMSWGVRPQAMLGHSIGEYVAACLSGVFALEDALAMVAARGRLLQALPSGAMLAVNLGEAALSPYLGMGCDLAAVNGPELCVLSGPSEIIEAAERDLAGRGVARQRLHVSHAFHSAMVEPACAALAARVASVTRRPPSIPFLSNVTGRWITAQEAMDPEYWARHLRSAVRFSDGLRELLREPRRALLEVGPSETLCELARRHSDAANAATIVSSLPHPQRRASAADHFPLALGRLWLAGVEVDWRALHIGERRRRVPLPTYPFERRSYWVAPAESAMRSARAGADWSCAFDDWFHIPSWRRIDAPRGAPPQAEGSTLLLGDGDPATARLGAHLRAQGAHVVVVEIGARFERCDDAHYRLGPGRREDFEQLLRAVGSEHGPVGRIVHLFNLLEPGAELAFAALQERGFYTLLALAQALEAVQPATPASIVIVTSGLEDVTGEEWLEPAQATLIGPCRVIPQEYPHLSCRLVDVEPGPTPGWIDRLAAEVSSGESAPIVAHRGAHRWTQSFMPLRRETTAAGALRSRGVYLITGGLGGVGLALAEHLARTVQARLALVGRSGPTAGQLEKLAALEALGARTLTIEADISRPQEALNAVARARAAFGEIHGVIHAAGDRGGGLISEKTAARVEQVFAAKIDGTKALMAALADTPLDFLMLCSSLSTIAGGLGKVDYCAANAYQDAVARAAARRSPFPVVAVDWDSWKEVGMAAHMAMPDGVGIAPDDGARAFEHILAGPLPPQVIVSTLDLESRLEHARGDLLSQPLAPEPAERRGDHARPFLATAFEAPQNELQESVAEIWRGMLGIAEIGIHDNLFELGGDSLLGIQILSRMRAKFAVELHPASLFKHPTIAGLAVVVETLLIEEIERAESLALTD